MTTLVYLYAVVARSLEATIDGIDGRPVRWLTGHGLTAVVSDVPSSDFDEGPLNERVRDMAWLGPRAVAHQEVNAQLFERLDAVLPLAFGTVFRDDERVRALLRDKRATLEGQLARVRGAAEWVLALHQLREPDAAEVVAASQTLQALRRQIETSPPGRAHLLRRQLATAERDEARRIQSEAADRVLDAVRRVALEVYREPLPSDTVERPLLRASVLVRRERDADFMDEIDRLRDQWPEPTYRLLLTGPWPAYRFGGLQDDA